MINNNQLLETEFELSDKKIQVFLLNLNSFNSDDFLSHLSEDERDRANRLKIEQKKHQFIVTRGALRKVLSNSLSKSAVDIMFSYGEHKKPYIEEQYNNKTVEFNVSHSGDYALIAITLNAKVGVDIEKINLDIDYSSLSKRFFSEQERSELSCLEKEEQLDAFYRAWVRKESFIKATGIGIAFGLDRFSVSLDNDKKSIVSLSETEVKDKQWYCYDLMNVNNYKTALASCVRETELIFYQ